MWSLFNAQFSASIRKAKTLDISVFSSNNRGKGSLQQQSVFESPWVLLLCSCGRMFQEERPMWHIIHCNEMPGDVKDSSTADDGNRGTQITVVTDDSDRHATWCHGYLLELREISRRWMYRRQTLRSMVSGCLQCGKCFHCDWILFPCLCTCTLMTWTFSSSHLCKWSEILKLVQLKSH